MSSRLEIVWLPSAKFLTLQGDLLHWKVHFHVQDKCWGFLATCWQACVRSVLAPIGPPPLLPVLLTRVSALPEWAYWLKPQLPSCKLCKIGAGHLVLIHTPTRGGRSQHSWVLQWGLHAIKVKEGLSGEHEGSSQFGKWLSLLGSGTPST